jgi:formylglycine-generating enzyme
MTNNVSLALFILVVVLSGCKSNNPAATETPDTQVPNHAPAVPSSPSPNDASTGVSTTPTLSWICSDAEGDSITYDVFFGTTSTPTTQVASTQTATYLSRTGLTADTKYYWEVNAKDSKGASTTGVVWSFTTGSIVIGKDMVQVTGGTFQMGSTNTLDVGANPPHTITVGSFSIDRYEVTYETWTTVAAWGATHGYSDLPTGKNGFDPVGLSNPVSTVSWYDIVKWCNARSEKDGLTPVYYTSNDFIPANIYRIGSIDLSNTMVIWTANGYRLPTEAEWEFAAKGGVKAQTPTSYIYSGSNTIDDVAWYSGNASGTHTAGTKTANELGIYDMSGNVWEWCWDWYALYSGVAQTDPQGPSTTQRFLRVQRGGSFYFDGRVGACCRSAFRVTSSVPGSRYSSVGFRCAQK